MHCYLKPRGGVWYIYEYDERTGECRRYSTRTRDHAEADKKLADHIIKLPQRQQFADATVLKILLRYYEHHGQKRFSVDTVKRVMSLVLEHEAETRLGDFTIARQQEFAEKCGKTSSTRRRYMGVIRAALQWSVDRGELPSMPAFFKVAAQDGSGVRPFTVEELTRLFAAATHEHERRLLLLCLAAAPRPGAALQLTWDRIDPDTGVVDFDVPGREKTKKRRAKAPLPPTALAYLEERRSIGPVVQWNDRPLRGHKMTFKRLTERAGITGTAYGIRKAVAIWLRREGVPEWDAKGMLGHAIGGETERYAHYRPEYMRSAAESTERLLRKISPPWLASYLPVDQPSVPRETQVAVVNDIFGGRYRDRTCDPYHVKDLICEAFQGLTPANDDG